LNKKYVPINIHKLTVDQMGFEPAAVGDITRVSPFSPFLQLNINPQTYAEENHQSARKTANMKTMPRTVTHNQLFDEIPITFKR
jgi:hypothetical protein